MPKFCHLRIYAKHRANAKVSIFLRSFAESLKKLPTHSLILYLMIQSKTTLEQLIIANKLHGNKNSYKNHRTHLIKTQWPTSQNWILLIFSNSKVHFGRVHKRYHNPSSSCVFTVRICSSFLACIHNNAKTRCLDNRTQIEFLIKNLFLVPNTVLFNSFNGFRNFELNSDFWGPGCSANYLAIISSYEFLIELQKFLLWEYIICA